jgi:DNA repair protein RecO
MEIRRYTGVVLATRNLGEADLVCRIYTREEGKGEYIFKGVRKSRRRSRTATEPGSRIEFLHYHHPDRESQVVSEFTGLRDTIPFRTDILRLYSLLYILEITDRSTASGEGGLYDFLESGLQVLEKSSRPRLVSLFYLVHLLARQGILPDFSRCQVCGTAMEKSLHIRKSTGEPVCPACGGGAVGEESRELLYRITREKYRDMENHPWDDSSIRDLLQGHTRYLEQHFGKKILSFDLLESCSHEALTDEAAQCREGDEGPDG